MSLRTGDYFQAPPRNLHGFRLNQDYSHAPLVPLAIGMSVLIPATCVASAPRASPVAGQPHLVLGTKRVSRGSPPNIEPSATAVQPHEGQASSGDIASLLGG